MLETLTGYKLRFTSDPVQPCKRAAYETSTHNKRQLKIAIDKLLDSEAIEESVASEGQFLSPIFLVPKPDGSYRFILNLKDLNVFIHKDHFKMEDLRTALNILKEGDFMCRLDLKEAYLMIPIAFEYRKFLRFRFNDKVYQFSALPFGLSPAPCVFTKLIKPILSWLRKRGVKIVAYIDDFLIFGNSKIECQEALQLTINLLQRLGLVINWEKSQLIPSKICKFLGVIINSDRMYLELPRDKKRKILKLVNKTLKDKKIKIESLAEVVGVLVSACQAVAYGWLFYKNLEKVKTRALFLHNNMKKITYLSNPAVRELEWWRDNISLAENKIRDCHFDLELFSDASTTGWGAVCGSQEAKGFWNSSEKEYHINYLEILAAFLALKCFAKDLTSSQILLRVDNLTALAYINKMGGTRHQNLHNIAKALWSWCMERDIWVFAEYVASKENPADEGSRLDNIDTEWELAPYAFKLICNNFGPPNIDLFASRANKKCNTFCSWDRDPDAYLINAMTLNWSNFFWYAFPPFALIAKVLKKVNEEGSRGIIIVPYWTSQPWFPVFKEITISKIIFLQPSESLLLSPCRRLKHPLSDQLTLVSAVLQGRPIKRRTSEMTL